MVEIVFGDSVCGSLKMAQHCGEGKYQEGCIGVFVSHEDGTEPTPEEIIAAQQEAKERMRSAWENAVPLGGNPADVYGFSLMLSVGDISENQPGVKRTQALEHLYSIYPNDEGRQAAQELHEQADKNLSIVRERIATGELIRVWYSNQPDEMCGFYWFMGQVSQWHAHDGQVFIVKFPEWEMDEKGTLSQNTHWGDVAPGEWHRYLSLQKPVSPAFVQGCAVSWQKLQGENAALRAVLNGQLVSITETLYDDFILREIAAEGDEFQEAMVIGRVLGKYHLGIGDAWIAYRIEEMIRAGKLEAISVASADSPIYHRKLKKCSLINL